MDVVVWWILQGPQEQQEQQQEQVTHRPKIQPTMVVESLQNDDFAVVSVVVAVN
jgi:hypothetical protein